MSVSGVSRKRNLRFKINKAVQISDILTKIIKGN